MAGPTRRELLTVTGAATGAATGVVAGAALAIPAGLAAADIDTIGRDLDRYIGFGIKASGGAGDTASGDWLEGELDRAGFTVERQAFDAPWFEPTRAELVCGLDRAAVIPQAIVVPTADNGVAGRLVRVDPVTGPAGPLAGAIALVELPFGRWSSATAKPIRAPVAAALKAGAAAAIVITTGPSGEALALNADGRAPMFDRPVAVLGPRQARPFLVAAASDKSATLHMTGKGGRRSAFNLVGRMDRGRGKWLVVSTPRSGWFACAGERGPGIAAWLALARWAGKALPDHDVAFVCNSGHEYEYLGSEMLLDHVAPPPADTAFWLHLGANVAARDWHEAGGGTLLPLPSADPQRFLVTTPDLVPAARRAFAGLPGLEMAYPAGQGTAGELTNIIAAGHARAAGIFGAHRFHHAAADDARCVCAAHVADVVAACRRLIAGL